MCNLRMIMLCFIFLYEHYLIILFVEYKLTLSGRLVEHLPISYEWVDDVHD